MVSIGTYKDQKKLVFDFHNIYKSATEENMRNALEVFDTKWSKRYLHIIKS